MKRAFVASLAVVTAIAFAAPAAFCQRPGRLMYNPSTETTVSGTVEQVRTMHYGGGWGGTHLDLKTEQGMFDVHLGPSAYIASTGFKFAKGDQIEVTGSKVKFEGHDAIIAREVKAGGKTLTLRDVHGIPEWGGRGWRSGRRAMPAPTP